MNKNIKGITIELEGDTTNIKQGFSDVEAQARSTGQQLKLINQQLKLDPGNLDLAAQKLQLLREQGENSAEKLERLKKVQDQIAEQYRQGVIDESQWVAFQQELAKTEIQLQRTENQIAKIAGASDDAADSEKKAGEEAKGWADVLKGSLLADAIKKGLEALVDTMKDLAEKSLEVGKNFDTAMSQVAATMGIDKASEEFGKLSEAAEQMGATTKYTAAEASEALNYLALAGYSADEAIGALPTVLNLAQAGGMDLAKASDMVTDSISALNLEQEDMTDLVDKMAVAAQKSNTSVSQLGDALLTIGGTGATLKGGVTELNTLLGVLADNGIKASEGGTKLRNVIMSLTAPTDKASEKLAELGVSAFDDSGNMRDMVDIISDLNGALGDMTAADKADALNVIFNKQDMAAVNALLSTSSERFEELSGYIEGSSGAAEQMAATMNDNLEGALAGVNSAFEAFSKSLYDGVSEPLKDSANKVAEILRGMTEMSDPEAIKESIGELSTYVNEGLESLKEMLESAGDELIPTLLDGINASIADVSESGTEVILEFVNGLIKSIPYLVDGALKIVTGLANGIGDSLPELIPAAVDAVLEIVNAISNNLEPILGAAVNIIAGLIEGLFKALPELLQRAPEIVIRLAEAIIECIPTIANIGFEIGNAVVDGLTSYDWVDGAQQTVSNIVTSFKDAFNNAHAGFAVLLDNWFTGGKKYGGDKSLVTTAFEEAAEETEEAAVEYGEMSKSAAEFMAENAKKNAQIVADAEEQAAATIDESKAKSAEIDEKALKEQQKADEKARKEREKAEKQAQKEREKAEKQRQREEEKARKQAEKDAETARKSAVKNVEKEIDEIYDAYEKKYKELQKLKDTAYKKLMSIGGDVFSFTKDKDGNTTATVEDMKKQMQDMKAFYDDVKKLKDSGASQELINEILSMSNEEATEFADYLANMDKAEFDNLNALYKQKGEYAKELSDMLYEDDEKALDKELSKALGDYYDGSADAQAYADDFIAALKSRDSDFHKAFAEVIGGNIQSLISGVKLPGAQSVAVPVTAAAPAQSAAATATTTQTAQQTVTATDSTTRLLSAIYELLGEISEKLDRSTAVKVSITPDINKIAKEVSAVMERDKRIKST